MTTNLNRIAVIGFGEVGQIIAAGLKEHGAAAVSVYDILFEKPGSRPRAAANRIGVRAAASHADAVKDAQLVISAVTAGSAPDAARSVAAAIGPGTFVMDMNSVAPDTKRRISDTVNGAGGRFVEAAVMAPVPPYGLKTPILLGGLHAEALLPTLAELGFAATKFHSPEVGRASSVKMCRSVIIKGLEALMLESMLAARHYGVTEEVLASLGETFPGRDMHKFAAYLISRSLLHGKRRSEEMTESAITVEDSGLQATMTRPIAAVQAWSAEHGAKLDKDFLNKPDFHALLAALPDNATLTSVWREAAQ